jgi:Tol biopolymer transport system component
MPLVLALLIALSRPPVAAQTARPPGWVGRVSLSSTGVQADRASRRPAISADGRFIAFDSKADNLVPGGPPCVNQVYVYDRATRRIERVSRSTAGEPADDWSGDPSISQDGRYVVFTSRARNLDSARDWNGVEDVYLHDRWTGETRLISRSMAGLAAMGISGNAQVTPTGSFVVFESNAIDLAPGETWGWVNVYVLEVATGTITRACRGLLSRPPNNHCWNPRISADGRWVFFQSYAVNLVLGDDNDAIDVFRYDRQTGETVLVSVDVSGQQGASRLSSGSPSISADGLRVAFSSDAVLVPGDGNGVADIFVRDFRDGSIVRASVSVARLEADRDCYTPELSPDGRFVAFVSAAWTLVPVSYLPPPEPQRWVNVFQKDLDLGDVSCLSVSPSGLMGNGDSQRPSISAGGRCVAFESDATNLVPGDTNWSTDVLVHDLSGAGLSAVGMPRPGFRATLELRAPARAGEPYVLAASLGMERGIAIGERRFPLDPDALFFLSLSDLRWFHGFFGAFDATGRATAAIDLPADLPLGAMFYLAFVTLDVGSPSGIGAISDAFMLEAAR